jgi:hypothetical protein
LKATLLFPPGTPPDGHFLVGQPIPITLQLENVSGAPVATTQGFSATDFFRRLYFLDPNGGTIINKIEEQVHGDSRVFMCLSRGGVLQATAIPIVPIEALAGDATPPHFFREFQIPDARTLYDLSRPGAYNVNARIPLLVFALSDPGAIIANCDQVPGTNANVASVTGRTSFTVVSNTLAFSVDGVAPLPPQTTVTVSPVANGAGWETQPATVAFTACTPASPGGPCATPGIPIQRIVVQTSGAQTGQVSLQGAQGSIVVSAQGQTSVAYHAEDSAGNIEATSQPLVIKVDSVAPAISVTSPAATTYTRNQTVLAEYQCADATSGVASCAGSVANGAAIDTSTAGTKTFVVNATDVAGNHAAPVTITYTVVSPDTVPPTTTASASPPPNAAGWNTTAVAVTLSAVDNAGGSGVKQITYTINGGAPATIAGASTQVAIVNEGISTLSYFATDNAGNVESAHALVVRIDKTKPVIAGMPAAGCALWPPNGAMTQIATVTATDLAAGGPPPVASGIAAGSLTVTVTSNEATKPGEIAVTGGVVKVAANRAGGGNGRVYTVTATVKDVAGNTTTVTGTCSVPHDQSKK